jgi:hypothetical protein
MEVDYDTEAGEIKIYGKVKGSKKKKEAKLPDSPEKKEE